LDNQRHSIDWQVEVFFDGDCPLCVREIKLLRWLDRRHRIQFTDIASADFSVQDYRWTMEEFMSEIRGRLPDGLWIDGVEVFRRLYAAVGFGPLVSLTRLPLLSHSLDWGYRVFAKNRLRLTGRCSDDGCRVN
jgi:predicted DCC family thiol-disulfide oxidoreductase YuxK